MEAVVAAAKHNGGDARHDRLALDVQVAVHLVRPPPANKPDAIGIDATTQHGHCPARTSRAGGDILGSKVGKGWREKSNSASE